MNKIYSLLYSLDSSGNIRIWRMEQNDNRYRTISGLKNGKLVASGWTVALPKNRDKSNSTNAIEQASLEVESQYKKKLKTGYAKKIDKVGKSYFQVMLAKEYEKYKHKINWAEGIGVQIKYNGGRAVATKKGIFTRTGEKYLSIPHIEEFLKPFFNEFPNATLDGEMFNFDLRENLNEIMSILRKTVNITQEDIEKSKQLIRFYIYDGAGFGCSFKDEYITRKALIDEYFDLLEDKVCVQNTPVWLVYSEAELEKLYQTFLLDNHEGAIIRILNQSYENKRSKFLLKYKPVDDDEAVILDINEADGNWAGTGKIITLKWRDKVFDATFKGPHDKAVRFLKDKKKWIGKEITFLYNGLTGLGIPNFARMDINNCLKK